MLGRSSASVSGLATVVPFVQLRGQLRRPPAALDRERLPERLRQIVF